MPPKKERARTRKVVQAAQNAEFDRDLKKFARAALDGFTCNCCFEPTYYIHCDGSDDFLEYGYNCCEGHIICFACWFALNQEQQSAGTTNPWKCPTCRVLVPMKGIIPSGIIKEGGISCDTVTGKVYYLKQGEKVFLLDGESVADESVAGVIATLDQVNGP